MIHRCEKLPSCYMLVSIKNSWYLFNNSVGEITGTHIDGIIPIFYCPWCGEKLE
jgi:hypothetical protein